MAEMAETSCGESPQASRYLKAIRKHSRNARSSFWETQRYNISTLCSQPLAEISGSLGDLGTLLPILIALSTHHQISLSSTLLFSGLANILTGLTFGIPLPVQPMKAIAAIALSNSLTLEQVTGAGIFVSASIAFLSLTGLINWFTTAIPTPVVKGIQMGTGLSLILSAGNLFPKPSFTNWVVLFLAFLGLLLSNLTRRLPYALLLMLLGTLASIIFTPTNSPPFPSPNLWHPQTYPPTPSDLRTGILSYGLGQLPLTTLNSIIAVSALSTSLLPSRPQPSTTVLGLSVAAINLTACWFGAMPVCHGSGGLAAQYRFGARSGSSIIILGVVKVVLGLGASEVALRVFEGFPGVLLVVMLVGAGVELVRVGAEVDGVGELGGLGQGVNGKVAQGFIDEERKRRWAVLIMTVAGILAFRNDAVGFAAGMLCHWSFLLEDAWRERSRRGEGRIRLGSHDTHNVGP